MDRTPATDRTEAVQSLVEALMGEYGEVLIPFVVLMDAELRANADKGDRPGWRSMDRQTALLEIYYHLAKLQKAALDDEHERIREYAADVANMSMMLVDVCGLLTANGAGNESTSAGHVHSLESNEDKSND